MIYLYDSTETDFRYNGKPLSTAYDVEVQNTLNSEYYVTGKHPLDNGGTYKEIIEDRIVKVHTMDGMQPFRIINVSKHELYIEFEAWPLFYADMRNKLVKPLALKGVGGQAVLNTFVNNLLIDTPFQFYSDITTTHDYHTQDSNEKENNPKQLYSALDVLKDIVNRWNGELWVRGYDVRVNNRIGTDTEAMLYEKKNITEFVDTTNIEGIVTRLHGKSEWQDERLEGEEEGKKHSIEVTVDSPLINHYSGVFFEKQYTNNDIRTEQELKNWLNLKYTTENVDKPIRTIEVGTHIIDGTPIKIGDTLILKYTKHDVDVRIKVVGYVYDGFADKVKSLVLGEPKSTLSSNIGNTITGIVDNIVSPIDRNTTIAMNSADGKSTVFHGTADPNTLNLNAKENDTYFRTNGSEKEIWRFTGTLWELIMDTSDTTKNADAIAEQQQDIDDAKQTADEAVDEINTAITNAGFTSLDDTIQNMNYITMNAEQSAQQAITDASNAHSLAQTSISEAQTAQANSLTALGKADNALDGVSSLDVRVDDVEAELELKADNTFMNEDGTLTTLSNAITFNAYRFSSDMSRIESRVESLAGEINLVVLRDAFENSRLNPGTLYPNPAITGPAYQTMRELIAVQGGEKIAMSKENSPSGYNEFRFNFYDDTGAYLTGETTTLNQYIVTVPQNATKMWVSYPTGSRPQIVRGTNFVPYRPNLADQMTSDEMVIFRNEYDEYADRTERRLSAIDSSGGRLETAEALITQTANGLQSTVGKVDSQGLRLSTIEQTAQGLQTTVADKANQSQVTQLALGLQATVSRLPQFIFNSNFDNGSSLGWEGVTIESADETSPTKHYAALRQRDAYFGDLIPVEAGERLTFSIHAWNISTTPQPFAFGVRYYDKNGNGLAWQKVIETSVPYTKTTYTGNWVVRNIARYVRPWVNIDENSNFTSWFFTNPQISRVPTNAQMSMLENNINLRVEKGDVLSQINVEAERTLIQSNRLLLNANNTVITGTAWMDGAVIANASIDGAKITDATIGSAKIASLDASKISAGIITGANSSWNLNTGIHRTNSPSNSNIRTELADGRLLLSSNAAGDTRQVELDGQGLTYTTLSKQGRLRFNGTNFVMDTNLGLNSNHINSVDWIRIIGQPGDTMDTAIFNSPNHDGSIISDTRQITIGHGSRSSVTRVASFSGTIQFMQNLYMNNNLVAGINRLSLNNSTTHLMSLTTGGLLVDGARITIATGSPSSIDTVARFDGQINFYKNVLLNGNSIIEGSDERIKENIVDRTEDDLATIMAIDYKNYDMIGGNKNQRGFIAQQLQLIDSELIVENEGRLGFNSSGYMHTIGHAVQQLAHQHNAVEQLAETNEEKIHQLQQELSKANRRIEELESVM